MKTSALIALLGAAAAKNAADTKKVEAIVNGLLRGSVEAEKLEDSTTCLEDVFEVVADAQTAAQDFKYADWPHIKEGIDALTDLV